MGVGDGRRVSAGGGYGVMRPLDALPWDAFCLRPKWLVGFSDITALHVEAATRNICSLHAMNVTGLGRSVSSIERQSFVDALEGRPLAAWTGLDLLHAFGPQCASVTGPIVGGNLSLVVSMAAAGRRVIPDGSVVFLEDVTERPYRVDRMLTSLRLGGWLARASAIVFGGFTHCDAGPDGVSVADVLRARTA